MCVSVSSELKYESRPAPSGLVRRRRTLPTYFTNMPWGWFFCVSAFRSPLLSRVLSFLQQTVTVSVSVLSSLLFLRAASPFRQWPLACALRSLSYCAPLLPYALMGMTRRLGGSRRHTASIALSPVSVAACSASSSRGSGSRSPP